MTEAIFRRRWTRGELWVLAIAGAILVFITVSPMLGAAAKPHAHTFMWVFLAVLVGLQGLIPFAMLLARPTSGYRFTRVMIDRNKGIARLSAANIGTYLLEFGGRDLTKRQRGAIVMRELYTAIDDCLARGLSVELTTPLANSEKRAAQLRGRGFRERRYWLLTPFIGYVPWFIAGSTLILMARVTNARLQGPFRTWVYP